MPKKYILTEEDKQLFRDKIGQVSPIKNERQILKTRQPKPVPLKKTTLKKHANHELLVSDHFEFAELDSEHELSYCRSGMQHNTLKKLRRGHYSINAELDLHGLFVVEAKQALANFLYQCHQHDFRCIRIIHGKGNRSYQNKPVLKQKLSNWLRLRNDVLAYTPARLNDGGTGAIYVLLGKLK